MSSPVAPYKPSNLSVQSAAAFNTAAVGNVFSYTCPANKISRMVCATFRLIGGTAPSVDLRGTIGGNTLSLTRVSSSAQYSIQVWLNPGDTLAWNVSVAGAASTGDFYMAIEEYDT